MRHEADLLANILPRLSCIPGLTLYGPGPQHGDRAAVIPFTVEGVPPQLVAAILGYEWAIGVRAGCFCAQPYVLDLLGIDRAGQHRMRYDILHRRRDRMPGMVRLSFGVYNTIDEIDQLIEALVAIARGKHASYQVDRATGMYTPEGWQDTFSRSFIMSPPKL